MADPTPDQVQMANEVLSGTRQITGSSPATKEIEMSNDEEAKRQAMEIATPDFRAQVNASEQAGYSLPNQSPTEPGVGAESKSIDKLPDPFDTKAVEAEREQKRLDIKGPGE